MSLPRLFACGGVIVDDGDQKSRKLIRLSTTGPDRNVNLAIEDLRRHSLANIPDRLLDLLEIAAYVYAADSATSRGKSWESSAIESWRRDLAFLIPVRDLQFWTQPAVQLSLRSLLTFLADDTYTFRFTQSHTGALPKYFTFSESDESYSFDRVVLFSGGLDSLAGAVQTLEAGHSVLLVSHRSVSMTDKRQNALSAALAAEYPGRVTRIPVWINKDSRFNSEHTQRTRSFLYASVAAVIAHASLAKGIRFFENGVVSMNLPVADEALCARASRTTHPMSLSMMRKLLSSVLGRELCVDNPFFFKTKAEVVQVLLDAKKPRLIGLSRSCAHGFFQTRTRAHCGTCSQCVDRRLAVLATGAGEYDSANDYAVDVLLGERDKGYQFNIAVDYARHAFELDRMDPTEFASRFNTEISRAVRDEANPGESASAIVELHSRHAASVLKVLRSELAGHVDDLLLGRIPKSSMLGALAQADHLQSGWKRLADSISEVLGRALPAMDAEGFASTEPDLQKLCEGVLTSHELQLVRESPLLRWAVVGTKPDWSDQSKGLWVELKYVRKRTDVAEIASAVAEDITKYGDIGAKCLFVVYDPKHLLKDEEFQSAIEKHIGMYFRPLR